ncbi:MAG: hypothetical protein ACTSVK_07290 [Promethearchaeota archaeon]
MENTENTKKKYVCYHCKKTAMGYYDVIESDGITLVINQSYFSEMYNDFFVNCIGDMKYFHDDEEIGYYGVPNVCDTCIKEILRDIAGGNKELNEKLQELVRNNEAIKKLFF